MANKSENTSAQAGGTGFLGALFLVFLVLKLTGVIQWSWWWVTAPLWGWIAVVVVAIAVTFCYFAVAETLKSRKRK